MAWYDPWGVVADLIGFSMPDPEKPLPMLRCVDCSVFERNEPDVTCWMCGGQMVPDREPFLVNASHGRNRA